MANMPVNVEEELRGRHCCYCERPATVLVVELALNRATTKMGRVKTCYCSECEPDGKRRRALQFARDLGAQYGFSVTG